MRPIEYGLAPTTLADDAVDVSMTQSPNTSAVQSVGLVFMDTPQRVTGFAQAHGACYAGDEAIDSGIDDANNYSVKIKRVSPTMYIVAGSPWHDNGITHVIRKIRQIATGAMLSTADLLTPTTEPYCVRKDEVAMPQQRSWLHHLHLAEPSVPCPPTRITDSYRIFPPAW